MKIHMVKKGDTLWSIAERFNVHPDTLFGMNPHVSNSEMLEPGTRVKIPHPPSPLEIPPAEFMDQYRVKQGDTLWKLSKAWNVPLKALISVNPQLRNPNVLLDGEVVYVPKLTAEIYREEMPVAQTAIIVEEPVLCDNPELSNEYEGQDQVSISAAGDVSVQDPAHWGESYPAYMTSAAKPYEMYGADPQTNVPSYPNYESLSDEEVHQKKERTNKEVNRTSGKSASKIASPTSKGKTRASKSSTRNAVAAIAVPSGQSHRKNLSKPVKRSSQPWTNI